MKLSSTDKKICGVCGGLANQFGIDVAFVRAGFVVATLLGAGSPILIYFVLALVMDKE